jgi:hypothetical protein
MQANGVGAFQGGVGGCVNLSTRSTSACTAAGLVPNTAYAARVYERCNDADMSSAWSVDASRESVVSFGRDLILNGGQVGSITFASVIYCSLACAINTHLDAFILFFLPYRAR